MAISLDGLDDDFRASLEKTLDACAKVGVVMIPYFGRRTPLEQARLWRQSRTKQQIDAGIQKLKDHGAPFLADCIVSAGPQHGPPVTGAMPGFSWHQWLEAMDCYWERDGDAEWSTDLLGEKNGYRIFASKATAAGLTAGGYWQSLKDWPHVQKRASGSPISAGMTYAEINAKMQELYG
jgi:hypothetical protein